MQYNIIVIKEQQAQQRIDNFLFKSLKGVPKSHIYRMLRKGLVRVNKKRIKPTYKVQTADQIYLPQIRTAVKEEQVPSTQAIKLLQERILYEDENLIVVNKPAGMAVHGGSGIKCGLIEAFRAMRPEAEFIELVHRLDKDTSGCLILAKKRDILKELHQLLRDGKIIKTYLALVRGKWQGGKQMVNVALMPKQLQSSERVVKVAEQGKQAVTEFKPRQKFVLATLMEAILHTGRMHQIRVHAAHLGYPVAGDRKYGSKEFNKLMRRYKLRRLFLHAASVSFKIAGQKQMIVTAALEQDLATVLQQLG